MSANGKLQGDRPGLLVVNQGIYSFGEGEMTIQGGKGHQLEAKVLRDASLAWGGILGNSGAR